MQQPCRLTTLLSVPASASRLKLRERPHVPTLQSPRPAVSPPRAIPRPPHLPPRQAPEPTIELRSSPQPPAPQHPQRETPCDPVPSASAASPQPETPHEYPSLLRQTHSLRCHSSQFSGQRLHLALAAYTKRCPLMNPLRLDIENPVDAGRSHPACLLCNKRQRIRLI